MGAGTKGIFDMPELAFAYAVGKEMAYRAMARYPGEKVDWRREVGDGNRGITDLVLHVGPLGTIAVEFKLAAPREKYRADAIKLQVPGLHEATERAICLLVDAFKDASVDDGRIRWLCERCGPAIQRVGDLYPFLTKSGGFRKEMTCVVGVWTVDPAHQINMDP
jgi:hypothetical protein